MHHHSSFHTPSTIPSSSTYHYLFFFFNDTATTEIYTLSLHDALPICGPSRLGRLPHAAVAADSAAEDRCSERLEVGDRKSTRLNSSHGYISYAVFCLKKKKRQ